MTVLILLVLTTIAFLAFLAIVGREPKRRADDEQDLERREAMAREQKRFDDEERFS
jgi:hypothetical protein